MIKRQMPRLLYLYPSAVLRVAWAFTFGLFDSSTRLFIALIGYGAPWFRSPIPTLPLPEAIGSLPQITLYESDARSGNISFVELLVLAAQALHAEPRSLFELGTFDGRTALNLIAHAPPDAHLYTLDLPANESGKTRFAVAPGEKAFIEKSSSGLRFQKTPLAARITQLYGDSATFDFSPYFGQIDFVFIDASHVYDYVRCDTETAFRLLRPTGGLIFWHDYSRDWGDVIRALDGYYRRDARFRNLRRIEGTTLAMLRVGPT